MVRAAMPSMSPTGSRKPVSACFTTSAGRPRRSRPRARRTPSASERREPERLELGGEQEHVGQRRRAPRCGPAAPGSGRDPAAPAGAPGPARRRAPGPSPDHQQHRRDLAVHALEDAHDVQHALHGPEVRDAEQDLLARAWRRRRDPGSRAVAAVAGEVDEVRDHLDARFAIWNSSTVILLQELRDRGHAVRSARCRSA